MNTETELSFLLKLLLDYKLPKAVRDEIANRMRSIEGNSVRVQPAAQPNVAHPAIPQNLPPHIAMQPPSTQAALLRQLASAPMQIAPLPGLVEGNVEAPVMPPIPVAAPEPVAQVAQTPAAAAALASRNAAINAAIGGSIDKARGRPRKF